MRRFAYGVQHRESNTAGQKRNRRAGEGEFMRNSDGEDVMQNDFGAGFARKLFE